MQRICRSVFALIIKNPVDFADNKIRLKQSGSIVTLDAIAKDISSILWRIF